MVYCVDTLGGSDLPYKKKKYGRICPQSLLQYSTKTLVPWLDCQGSIPGRRYRTLEFVPNPCYSIARRPWFLGWAVRVPYQAGDIELTIRHQVQTSYGHHTGLHSGPFLEKYLIPR